MVYGYCLLMIVVDALMLVLMFSSCCWCWFDVDYDVLMIWCCGFWLLIVVFTLGVLLVTNW